MHRPPTAPAAYVAASYWWNRPTLRALLTGPAGPPTFCWSIDEAVTRAQRDRAPVYAWASRLQPHHEAAARDAAVPLYRIEDGFIRSIGLGAGFVTAASLAIDSRGIYYDATRPSDLEYDLEHADLGPDAVSAGNEIRHRILEARLSKYNLTAGREEPPFGHAEGRRIVLVPGQVGDDASILQTVSETIDTRAPETADGNVNVQLLHHARERNPDAWIVFKPHPDVTSGLRRGAVPDAIARRYADQVLTSADIIRLIDAADAVETISSLAGFEALLRGKPVTCHGTPFYAGWGLTTDLAPLPRRTRRRTLDELTAVAFTRYTRHVHPYTGRECTCTDLIDGLVRQRTDRRHHARNAILKRAAWLCEKLNL